MQGQGLHEQTLTGRILFTSLSSGYRLHRPVPLYLEKSGDADCHKNSHLLTVLIVLILCLQVSVGREFSKSMELGAELGS